MNTLTPSKLAAARGRFVVTERWTRMRVREFLAARADALAAIDAARARAAARHTSMAAVAPPEQEKPAAAPARGSAATHARHRGEDEGRDIAGWGRG